MGKNTKISWCDSTVNPVVGCDGCELHRAGDPVSHRYAAGRQAMAPGAGGEMNERQLMDLEQVAPGQIRHEANTRMLRLLGNREAACRP